MKLPFVIWGLCIVLASCGSEKKSELTQEKKEFVDSVKTDMTQITDSKPKHEIDTLAWLMSTDVLNCSLFKEGKARHWQKFPELLKIWSKKQSKKRLDEHFCTYNFDTVNQFLINKNSFFAPGFHPQSYGNNYSFVQVLNDSLTDVLQLNEMTQAYYVGYGKKLEIDYFIKNKTKIEVHYTFNLTGFDSEKNDRLGFGLLKDKKETIIYEWNKNKKKFLPIFISNKKFTFKEYYGIEDFMKAYKSEIDYLRKYGSINVKKIIAAMDTCPY